MNFYKRSYVYQCFTMTNLKMNQTILNDKYGIKYEKYFNSLDAG